MEAVNSNALITEETKYPKPDILVAEDDEGLNYIIQNVLKREGFIVEGAKTGAEVISKIHDNPNRILFLDYILPDMTGKDVIKKLKTDKLKIPFIIMTGNGDEKIAVEMMKMGAKDYIVKDFNLVNMLPHSAKRISKELSKEKALAAAEKKLKEWQKNLSILYQISSAVSQTLDIKELFNIILDTIMRLEIFHTQHQAGIFLVEGDRMNLVASRTNSPDFVSKHKSMRIGDCVCGHAAKTGEVIISENCEYDTRHTIKYSGYVTHGHIIIPLRARDRITGVLFLYLKANAAVSEDRMNLLTAIGSQIGVAIDNAVLYEETRKFALHDPLTGLANRRMMHLSFGQTLERAKRFGKTFSVIMLDIDYFKEYNDNLGHSEGDALLVKLAHIAKSQLRSIDLVTRYGGEEFLVLLPDTEMERACEVAERMRNSVETKTDVTISLGIASYSNGMQQAELINYADQALYRAKQRGRNRVECMKQPV